MAAHLPCLPGSPSVSKGVLTSFVPSAHIQGASAAPSQGHALWKQFLPATGSFFVVLLTIRFSYQHLTADVFLICSPSCHSPREPVFLFVTGARCPFYRRLVLAASRLVTLCYWLRYRRSPNVSKHLGTVITLTGTHDHEKHP